MIQRSVRLPDGRRLGYAATGPVDGFPVYYLHGAIGSPPRSGCDLDGVIAQLQLRYVMVSRPGFGASDRHQGRTLRSFAADLVALADALGHERFGVVGVSAGGPYALACAHELSARVTAVAAVSCLSHLCAPWAVAGVAPRTRIALRALALEPDVTARVGDAALSLVRRHPQLLLGAMTMGSCAADRALLDEQDTTQIAVDGFLTATSGGVRGLIDDYVICTRPWGFDPADITAEVHVWHGARDALVPAAHAAQLAAALPNGHLAIDPDDGHFFLRRRLQEILGGLCPAHAGAPCRALAA